MRPVTKRARERLFLSISGVAVAAALVVGFLRLGPPSRQREFEADAKRTENLFQIAQWISYRTERYRPEQERKLPASLDELRQSARNIRTTDPVTSRPYEYRVKSEREYELCAVFDTDSKDSIDQPQSGTPILFWSHPRGRHCFQLDAGNPAPVYQRY